MKFLNDYFSEYKKLLEFDKKEINIVKYSEIGLLGLVHNRPLNNVVRISLVPMHSTFNFTLTTSP